MSIRFIHTADLQIGMTASGSGAMASALRDARVQALERVLAVGRERNADFIVIAGDLFEGNDISLELVRRTASVLQSSPLPVYIIAGNHDHAGPESIYRNNAFEPGNHVEVLLEHTPRILEPLDLALYPCSCLERRSETSPLSWIQKDVSTRFHVAIAHGSWTGGPRLQENDYPMSTEELEGLGLDYIALGHWHSTYPDPDRTQSGAFYYSGTPEPTGFGERDSGNVLFVELDPGSRKVEKIPVARYKFLDIDVQVSDETSVADIARKFDSLDSPDTTLVRIRLKGVAGLSVHEAIHEMIEQERSRFALVRIDDSGMLVSPGEKDFAQFAPGGIASVTFRLLEQSDDIDPRLRSRALDLAYRFFKT